MNDKTKIAYVSGFLGATAMTLGLLISAIAYRGVVGESYSLSRHLVSELGETNVSEAWWLFSVSLILGGIIFGVFMAAVGTHFTGFIRAAIITGGIIVGIFGMLVGVFPLDTNANAHTIAAMIFFFTALTVVTIFSAHLLFGSQTVFPKWIGFAGLPMIISVATFLLSALVMAVQDGLINPHISDRATFELVMFSEWCVLIFLLVWGVIVSVHLLTRKST